MKFELVDVFAVEVEVVVVVAEAFKSDMRLSLQMKRWKGFTS